MDGTERDMLQFVVYRAESGNDIKWTTEELDSERTIWQLLQELQKKKKKKMPDSWCARDS